MLRMRTSRRYGGTGNRGSVSGLQGMLKLAGAIDRLPFPEVPHGEEGLIETLWLLLTSVIAVPLVCKLPGGSPVLGFLV